MSEGCCCQCHSGSGYVWSIPTATITCNICARQFVVKVEYGEPLPVTCNSCIRSADAKAHF